MSKNVIKPARERLLETASRLFYQEGLRATGIDRIIAESGVAKMSFYRHFPSKDHLILAFLERRHEYWMGWFQSAVERRLQESGVGLEVIAKVLEEWFADPKYRGCAFINAVAEGGVSVNPAIRELSVRHKVELEEYVTTVAEKLGYSAPRPAAMEAMLIIEGMIVRYQMTTDLSTIQGGAELLAQCGRERDVTG